MENCCLESSREWRGFGYRLVEVQDEAEEQSVAAFQLQAHRRQPAPEVDQLYHRVLESRQSHVSGTGDRGQSVRQLNADASVRERLKSLCPAHGKSRTRPWEKSRAESKNPAWKWISGLSGSCTDTGCSYSPGINALVQLEVEESCNRTLYSSKQMPIKVRNW